MNAASISIKHFVVNLLMLQNAPSLSGLMGESPFGFSQFGSGRPLWTLSFEWWLYMSFGMAYFLREQIFERKWLILFGCVAFVPIANMMSSSRYAGGLALVWVLGSLLWLSRPHWTKIGTNSIVTIAIGSIGLAVIDFAVPVIRGRPFNMYDLNFMIIISIAISSIIIYVSKLESRSEDYEHSYASLFANYSYTLYLVHYSIIYLMIKVMNDYSKWSIFLFCIVISNLIALILSIFTEAKHKELRYLIWKLSDNFSGFRDRTKFTAKNK